MGHAAGSLDTNILLRLLLDDVPDQHQVALRLFNETVGQLAVADTAIIEMVFVLERAYELTRPQVREAINGLLGSVKLNCNKGLFEDSLPLYVAHSALSFEDCCLATYAKLNNAEPLWTFDKKLAKQVAGTRLVS